MMKLVEWVKNDGFQCHQRNFTSELTQKTSPKKGSKQMQVGEAHK
jgi:hypothetical protein